MPDDAAYLSLRCEFTITNTDTDTTVWQCERTDAETVEMYDGGQVRICPEHRSWVPSLSAANR